MFWTMSTTEGGADCDDTKYKIVLFDDGLQLVPKNWVNSDKSFCWWPNYKNITKYYKAVQASEEVDREWSKCEILRILSGSDSFERAKEKLKMAECQSDLNTDTEEKHNRHKRAKKGETSPSPFEDSSDEDVESLTSKMPEYPRPQKQRRLDYDHSSSSSYPGETSVKTTPPSNTSTSSKVFQIPPMHTQQGKTFYIVYYSY